MECYWAKIMQARGSGNANRPKITKYHWIIMAVRWWLWGLSFVSSPSPWEEETIMMTIPRPLKNRSD